MSGISKRVSGSWVSGDYGIMKTATDTITTLPAVLYPNDATATVGLKGNMQQTGTPTPDSPITPQGTGERTGNLFDTSAITANRYVSDSNGELVYISGGVLCASDYIDISDASYVSISNQEENEWGAFYGADKVFISGISGYSSALQIPNNAKYMRLTVKTEVFNSFMVNLGSTALPYEPYGYKIPISSASTTTPVYLGEVETTRKVKKLVLDGTETWNKGNYPPTGGCQFFTAMPADIATNSDLITTHFKNGIVLNGSILNGSAFAIYLSLYPEASILPENATANDFKVWLAAQYAAGTPVTIWYVLATPTTGIVNEPLMKIGDYADTVSSITVPMITGKDTFDVETTLKPSEVSLSYTDWHNATVKEWDGSQWNE